MYTVELLWKGGREKEAKPLEGVDEILEAGKFLAWLNQTPEVNEVTLIGDVEAAYSDEQTGYVDKDEPVLAASRVHVDTDYPQFTEVAGLNHEYYSPTSLHSWSEVLRDRIDG